MTLQEIARPLFDRDDMERLKALFVRDRVSRLCEPYMEMTPQAARLQAEKEMVSLLYLYASQPPNPGDSLSLSGVVVVEEQKNDDARLAPASAIAPENLTNASATEAASGFQVECGNGKHIAWLDSHRCRCGAVSLQEADNAIAAPASEYPGCAEVSPGVYQQRPNNSLQEAVWKQEISEAAMEWAVSLTTTGEDPELWKKFTGTLDAAFVAIKGSAL